MSVMRNYEVYLPLEAVFVVPARSEQEAKQAVQHQITKLREALNEHSVSYDAQGVYFADRDIEVVDPDGDAEWR